jgi:hypothetical protein
MTRAVLRLLPLLFVPMAGCEPPPCSEPLQHGEGEVGDTCRSIADCREGLTCLGTSFATDALCAPVTELPGREDPGCLEHASDWAHHQADGVRPISTDDEGCEVLVFESACNCTGVIGDGGCRPTFPLYRQETWRSCSRCCWRLIAFWLEPEACDE